MKVTIKYFGMIAESVGKSEEVLELENGVSVEELKNIQTHKYDIKDAESVQISVNQEFSNNSELKEGDEVAFLPPFAGG